MSAEADEISDDLKREGKADQAAADVKEGVEKVADKAGDAVDKVKDKLSGKAIQVKPAGKGNTFVYGVRKGRVRYVGLASKTAAKNGRTLRKYLRLAGLR